MTQTVSLTRRQVGDAIVTFIRMKHASALFFPFYIKKSTWMTKFPILAQVMQCTDQKTLMSISSGAKIASADDFELELTRDEIIDALWIDLPRQTSKRFLKPEPADISVEIPDKVKFTVGYLPWGSTAGEYHHALE